MKIFLIMSDVTPYHKTAKVIDFYEWKIIIYALFEGTIRSENPFKNGIWELNDWLRSICKSVAEREHLTAR